ncbi:MAG: hypothetical protein Tsb0020_07710 [Haliangiales bacterium]
MSFDPLRGNAYSQSILIKSQLRLGLLLLLGCGALAACDGTSGATEQKKKPSGTMADPVEVCERIADVCRLNNGSQLGVCTPNSSGDSFICAPQH